MTTREMIIQLAFRVADSGLRGANNLIDRLRNGAGSADGAIRRMSAGMQKLNGAAGALVGTLGKVAAAMGVAFSAVAIKNAADEAMNLDNKLRVIYKEDEQGRRAMKDKIFDMANDARGSYTATGDLFYKVARTSETTGLSLDESARLAEIVSKGLSLSGADTGTAEGAILQLGQALSSGVLQGDELHALNEGAGALMQEMAKSMGVKIGDLKKMGAAGELTSDKVARAILDSGDEIDRQFATHVPTIGQAMQTISNTWTKTMGDIQDRTNVFGAIAEGLISGIKYVGGQVHAFMDLLEGKDEGRAEHPVLATFANGVKFVKNEIDYVKGSIKTLFAILDGDENAKKQHPVLATYANVVRLLQSKIETVRGMVKTFFAILEGDEEARRENPRLAAFADGINTVKQKIEEAKALLGDYYEMLGLKVKKKQDGDLDEEQTGRLAQLQKEHPVLEKMTNAVTGLERIWDTIMAIGNAIGSVLVGAINGVSDAINSLGFDWGSLYEDYSEGLLSLQQAWANMRPLIEAITPLLQFIGYVIGYVIVGAIYAFEKAGTLAFRAIAKLVEWLGALLGGIGETIKWLADGLTSILTLGSAVGNMKMPEHQWGDWKNAGGGGYSLTTNNNTLNATYNLPDQSSMLAQSQSDQTVFYKTSF